MIRNSINIVHISTKKKHPKNLNPFSDLNIRCTATVATIHHDRCARNRHTRKRACICVWELLHLRTTDHCGYRSYCTYRLGLIHYVKCRWVMSTRTDRCSCMCDSLRIRRHWLTNCNRNQLNYWCRRSGVYLIAGIYWSYHSH